MINDSVLVIISSFCCHVWLSRYFLEVRIIRQYVLPGNHSYAILIYFSTPLGMCAYWVVKERLQSSCGHSVAGLMPNPYHQKTCGKQYVFDKVCRYSMGGSLFAWNSMFFLLAPPATLHCSPDSSLLSDWLRKEQSSIRRSSSQPQLLHWTIFLEFVKV